MSVVADALRRSVVDEPGAHPLTPLGDAVPLETLRDRLLHAAAGSPAAAGVLLNLARTWPWATALVKALARLGIAAALRSRRFD